MAKMLAKKPDDRYQTPAEVIAVLTPWMGNSSRIMAGLSRTKLAQGADLQSTLSEMARNSSRRLNPAVVDDDDPDQVDVESGRETGAVAASITTRERRAKRAKKKAQAKWKPIYIYAAIAVGVSLIGVLAAWAISGGSKKHGTENQTAERSRHNEPGRATAEFGHRPSRTHRPG